jgi:hypothetical protein
MEKRSWKANLLSSSIPLEYEAAKILAEETFAVSSDYSFIKKDEQGIEKEFSCDIKARGYCPFSNPQKISLLFNLLVECKYRKPNTAFLFLQDPNRPEFSNGLIGSTMSVVDAFSYTFLRKEPIYKLEATMDWCFKGVEIDLADGKVCSAELRRGISQLQYALPQLMMSELRRSIWADVSENWPFAFAPILLTNAPLYVAKKDLCIQNLNETKELEDISYEVDALILNINSGPLFEVHCKHIFSDLGALLKEKNLKSIEEFRKKGGEWELPSYYISLLMHGLFPSEGMFSQIFVINMKKFQEFVKNLKAAIAETSRRRQIKKSKLLY